MELPIELINKILSFRGIHPLARIIKPYFDYHSENLWNVDFRKFTRSIRVKKYNKSVRKRYGGNNLVWVELKFMNGVFFTY